MSLHLSLNNLGWQPFFQQQLSLEEWEVCRPFRVMEQHRSVVELLDDHQELTLPLLSSIQTVTVGDWVLVNDQDRLVRVLERKSCFRRKAPGSKLEEQLIAANIDTAFIVCSLNHDFNLNRIERYLTIINDAGSNAVVVLSKQDLCDDPDSLRDQVVALDSLLCVETVNCLDPQSASVLKPWCQAGQTVVMLGSSGSGKSTLTNTLLGTEQQATAAIREDDSKGRHTTTRRSMLAMPDGALILDTPGMREIQLTESEAGISMTFSDIESLARGCRFSDCSHTSEPGCAVQRAIETGVMEVRRLQNYQKLLREQALNAASLAQRRAADKSLGRYYKRVQAEAKNVKRGS